MAEILESQFFEEFQTLNSFEFLARIFDASRDIGRCCVVLAVFKFFKI